MTSRTQAGRGRLPMTVVGNRRRDTGAGGSAAPRPLGAGRRPEKLFPEASRDDARLVAAEAVGVDEELAPADANHDRRLAATQGMHDRIGGVASDRRVNGEEEG